MTPTEKIKFYTLRSLVAYGPTGGEVLRRDVGHLVFGKSATYGRKWFAVVMQELIDEGVVKCTTRNWRHTYSLVAKSETATEA